MQVTVLGSSSATPTISRHQTSLVLSYGGKNYLLDCGEGAQIQMLRCGINQHRIESIFISHLHPDHFIGLIGFLTTQSLQKRAKPIQIYGPSGIQSIIDTQLYYSSAKLNFEISYHSLDEIQDGSLVCKDNQIQVRGFRLKHGIPCFGFLFEEYNHRYKLSKNAVHKHPPPIEAFPYLQKGQDYKDKLGKAYSASFYVVANPDRRSFAYLTDTRVQHHLAEWFKGVNLLYHEATFTSELAERAYHTEHATSQEAAYFAIASEVDKLLIGHFSARYQNLEPLLKEAQSIFPNTELATEGSIFAV